ncbi:MbnH family di-heme enzyme [Leptospira sp. GIMC2001]|uniref:MbnH family di-heme enzyme n=1 Tax=Leptospira sp. GIMC2001 TaxID=1513297 RepID=UPI00234A24BD|nr:MbnH family di-heme enzyme [Leptospira sp. GIMC2001]WCL49206.1 di-heme enzyme [Leptospira sp. GIMC2001]
MKKNISFFTKIILIFSNLLFFACDIPLLNDQKSNSDNELLLGLALLSQRSSYNWNLPPGFPEPRVPAENPMSIEKVELGRHLFYDRRLSQDETKACSSCHFQSLAFSDGKALPSGITGQVHPRNAQHLTNAAYHSRLTWNNPNLRTLEQQARVPMFGESPIELGLQDESFLSKLKLDSLYPELFNQAFGGGDGSITEQNVRFALASFQRSMISGNSPFDRAQNGNRTAITPSAARGASFFNSEIAECFHCHGGFNFTDTNLHGTQAEEEFAYHNNGTHTVAYYNSLGDIHKEGLKEITLQDSDQGKFRAPSLRNVAVTFPYMHDGSIMCDNNQNPNHPDGIANGASLSTCARNALGKVVDQYSSGGAAHPAKDGTLIRPFPIQPSEKEDLINFLLSLTDDEFLRNPKFSNPR